ncbi:DNA-binding YbaB/EbfC family protein [Mycoplasmoides fastidiosum]|uniref:DNA-binding YbaB/EbfC family protein n=1 Tax=Mycoplasmoides fastidiosum TaxID=92758 RepID=A0ABU0M0D9_9BACT|nr:YbaB/EbfC family nucleoid-associated protein [Mycoplasmoides fastidiosum]MDQ0514318.1 DNA-binding YbaB/EbfC family protein [Mycoplasmoides fastidiosum]UUD38079.1 YbaB/EbfC family nucleoid-associated protein [Mycoplasmoides fastidiosum]
MKDPRVLKRLIDEAKKTQKRLEEELTKFESQVYEQTFGADHVKIEIKGNLEINKIEINPALLEDKEMLEEIVTDAVNTVVRSISEARKHIEEELMPKNNLF